MSLHHKRVYAEPGPDDGLRILVDRLWPRGLTKEVASVDLWMKELAPSETLRNWFDHDAGKWTEFQERYRRELDRRPDAVDNLRDLMRTQNVTLLFAATDEAHNNAVALVNLLAV